MPTPRIAVIGTGTIGAQTPWQLAKHGADVTGYELFSLGHSRGAVGGETRLFRHIDVEHLEYLPITDRADLIWRELEQESGRTLRNLTGALAIGSTASPTTHIALESAALLGSRAEVLSREEAQLNTRAHQYQGRARRADTAQLACGGIVGKSGQGPAPAGAGQGAWRA